jgi:endonuclease/exonuclease/phosphatase family metal-dependent hydrolase
MQVRVLSWNIHKGIGGIDRRYRLDRVLEVLREYRPDVALLQEVADNWPGAGGDLQAELLSQNVPFGHFAFSPEHRFTTGGYGNAVLSKYPITATMRLDLKINWRKQRSALQACIALPDESRHRHLYATSLHLGLAEGERHQQMARLFDVEAHHAPEAPSIMGGDFNDVFGSIERRFMQPRGYHRMVPPQRTFPATLPCLKLDGIFGAHMKALPTPSVLSRCARTASDHLPLIAVCEIE